MANGMENGMANGMENNNKENKSQRIKVSQIYQTHKKSTSGLIETPNKES